MNMIIYYIFYVFMHKSNFSRFRHKGVDIVHTLVEMRKITLVQAFYILIGLLCFNLLHFVIVLTITFFRRNFFFNNKRLRRPKKQNKSKQSFITAKEFKSNYLLRQQLFQNDF